MIPAWRRPFGQDTAPNPSDLQAWQADEDLSFAAGPAPPQLGVPESPNNASTAAKRAFDNSGEIDYQFNDGDGAATWSVEVTPPDGARLSSFDPVSVAMTPLSPNFWISEGPGPGINGQEFVLPNNQIGGAIQAIAVHPTDPNIMYVGSVNGGIWKTTNATAASPHWVPLTDNLPSLSIGALEFDPTDATHQTLIAGIGSTSSYFLNDQFTGVLRSTDGGATWSQLGTSAANLGGENVTSVAARGTTLLAAADNGWGGGLGKGLFRSTNSGTSWTLISDGAHGLPNLRSVSDIVGDPLNLNVLYAAATGAGGGVFKSTDTGLTWTNITAGIGIISGTTDKIELAVHHDATNTSVFATVDNGGVLSGVFRSVNGAVFTALDVPSGGHQGFVHGAITADPANFNIAYVGYGGGSSHYLTRIDASQPLGSQITDISGGTFGSPHVDTREMQIDANGNLILGTDGGLFRLPTPRANTGVWSAVVGDMSVFELHSIAYDHVSKIIMAGAQDNGTLSQQTPGGATWDHPGFGDGGDVAIDDVSLAASGQSIRYFSSQFLGGWERQVYDSANHLVSTTFLASITDGQFTTPVELNNVDPTRVLVGGSGHIYASSNQGASLTAIANFGVNDIGGNGGGLMVYGGYQGTVADADLVYAASGANVLRQTTAGGGFTITAPGGGGIIRGVTDNPTNWATVFAIDNNQVFESTNAGVTWVDVTANLTSVSAADFRSIEYVHGTTDDALVVGTSSGAFYAKLSGLGGAASWSKFGTNLPDVIVYDLEYDAADNVLVAGTMGRGAWLVNNATTNLGIGSRIPVKHDFNGDGRSDILWRATNGDVYLWSFGAGLAHPGTDIGIVPINYSIAGTGDLNGDGKVDALWRSDTGDVYLWNSANGGIGTPGGLTGIDLGIVPLSYTVAALADFNGDGKADVLWRVDTGDVYLWSSTGGGIGAINGFQGTDLGIVPLSYQIAATGDFNGDGKTDVVWRSDTGDVYLWNSTGGGIGTTNGLNGIDLGIVPLDYRIAGTGDFNNDVRADILFRSTSSGDAYLWSSANGGIGAPGGFTGVDLGIVPTNYATQIGFA